MKKRPIFNPLIIHFKNIKDLKNEAIINKNFIILYKAFCPGPITFILKKNPKSHISSMALAKKQTIAARFPKHKVIRKLLKLLKVPLAAPSANISNKLSPTSARDVADEFKKNIKFILDGGNCKIGLESTIVDLTKKKIKILRPGSITMKQISNTLRKKVIIEKKSKKIVGPGQLKFHYSPGIPVKMNMKYPKKNQALIGFGRKFVAGKNRFNLSKKGNLKEAANNLYKIMRKIKKKKI